MLTQISYNYFGSEAPPLFPWAIATFGLGRNSTACNWSCWECSQETDLTNMNLPWPTFNQESSGLLKSTTTYYMHKFQVNVVNVGLLFQASGRSLSMWNRKVTNHHKLQSWAKTKKVGTIAECLQWVTTVLHIPHLADCSSDLACVSSSWHPAVHNMCTAYRWLWLH